jgi:hypothetical protein
MELNIRYQKSTKENHNDIIDQSGNFWSIGITLTVVLISFILITFPNNSHALTFITYILSYLAIMFYLFEIKLMGLRFNFQNFKLNPNFTETRAKKILPQQNILGKLYHDINGNVFINTNDTYYLISIDKNNDIELYDIDKSKLVDLPNIQNLEYDKIVDTEFTSLKRKVMDKIEEDEDSDQEEVYQNYKQKIKYLNEDKYYYSEYKENENENGDDDYNDDDEFEQFKFYKKEDDNSILLLNKGLDSPANYDTYIRDGSKNVVASLICNNTNAYRISFYKMEKNQACLIELNIIGNVIKTFYLCYGYDGEQIELKCNKICQKNNY